MRFEPPPPSKTQITLGDIENSDKFGSKRFGRHVSSKHRNTVLKSTLTVRPIFQIVFFLNLASQSKTSQSGETLEQRDPNNTPADPSDPQGDLVVPELGRVPVRDLLTFNPGDATAFKVIMTRTFVTVMWQDGTLESEVRNYVLSLSCW